MRSERRGESSAVVRSLAPVRWYIFASILLSILEADAMGRPLMLQDADADRIETLKKRLGARTKIEVVRSALDLLERDAERTERVVRWQRAVRLAAPESRRVSREFQRHSRLKRLG